MLRAVVLALLLIGCDQALGLEREGPPAVCGPFAKPTLVPFHPELVDPHDFSVDSSGSRGMIYAMFPRTGGRLTGVHAIKLENGMWRGDAARDTGAINSLDGGHIAEDNAAVGWIVKEGQDLPEVREYTFSTVTSMWGQGSSGVVDPQQGQTSTAGNLIVLPYATSTIRFLVTILMSDTPATPNTMRIFQLAPTRPTWELTPQADPLKTSRAKVNPSAGVMTANHGGLVYAAKVGGSVVSRLFASERERDEFAHGPELVIEGVESDADLTEPWINADCSVLYFRRDGVTWMARAVDDPGAGP